MQPIHKLHTVWWKQFNLLYERSGGFVEGVSLLCLFEITLVVFQMLDVGVEVGYLEFLLQALQHLHSVLNTELFHIDVVLFLEPGG